MSSDRCQWAPEGAKDRGAAPGGLLSPSDRKRAVWIAGHPGAGVGRQVLGTLEKNGGGGCQVGGRRVSGASRPERGRPVGRGSAELLESRWRCRSTDCRGVACSARGVDLGVRK